MPGYVDAVLQEASLRRKETDGPIETVYFGGGTPSLLPPALLRRLCLELKRILPVSPNAEWTAEANPGTITQEWVETAVSCGINRISLGMQAFQSRHLEMLGRIHRFSDVEKSVEICRLAGIHNLSLDLMFGLPGQTPVEWRETLEAAVLLQPQHLSAYGLIPEEGTPLFQDLQDGALSLPEPEEEREMYETALSVARQHGYVQYEISNFARPGFECAHNVGYWTQVPYLGLGASAASLTEMERSENGLRYVRRTNTGNLDEYRKGMESGSPVWTEVTPISPAEAQFETMMLGLRMNRGVSEERFAELHGIPLERRYGGKCRLLERKGLLVREGEVWKLTRLGMDLQNMALTELMD